MLLSANRKPSFITLGNSRTGNHSIVCHIGEEGCRKRGCKTFFFIKSSKKKRIIIGVLTL